MLRSPTILTLPLCGLEMEKSTSSNNLSTGVLTQTRALQWKVPTRDLPETGTVCLKHWTPHFSTRTASPIFSKIISIGGLTIGVFPWVYFWLTVPAGGIQLYFYRLILVTRPSPEPPRPGGLAASPNLWSKVSLESTMNVKSYRMTGELKQRLPDRFLKYVFYAYIWEMLTLTGKQFLFSEHFPG